jgi:predicted AlkP superfamily pyrophosphatase or phosphodiesterase
MFRRGLSTWLALGVLACGGASIGERASRLPSPDPTRSRPQRVLLVSVAGLTSERYAIAANGSSQMPTLAALATAGVAADAVTSVAPASTYPAHATLLTGRLPRDHGVVADRRLGERGVRSARLDHASSLRATTLWQLAEAAGFRVASLDWPSTLGASISLNLPEAEPGSGRSWLQRLVGKATPELLPLILEEGGGEPATARPGAGRDAALTGVACRLLRRSAAPSLVLLRLSQTRIALAAGWDAVTTAAAFTSADAQIERLLECLDDADVLARSSLVVVGDHGSVSVHSVLAPNVVLADTGLLTPDPYSDRLLSWSAIVRSNGGSAFVYAQSDADALLARRALELEAERTRSFRVVSAEEMMRLGADPEAWFGLEAVPGFAFTDVHKGPRLFAAAIGGTGGYLPGHAEMDVGFVAWGLGLRRGVRVPSMRLSDVAPTVGHLLGVDLEGGDGRVLVGVLDVPDAAAAPPRRPPGR